MIPLPKHLGLPKKFSAWRNYQPSAIQTAVSSEFPLVALCLPTGSGKSLINLAAAHMLEADAWVLTSTKALQDQLMKDFAGYGLVDLRGRSAYRCGRRSGLSCAEGPCRLIERPKPCPNCPYRLAVRRARSSQFVVTNYSYYLAHRLENLEPPTLLILDEAHHALRHLVASLSVAITRKDAQGVGVDWPSSATLGWVSRFTQANRGHLGLSKEANLDAMPKKEYLELLRRSHLEHQVRRVESGWLVARDGDRILVQPPDIKKYARLLWEGPRRVIATSATLTEGTLGLLNAPDWSYRGYPSSFPTENRLIHLVPTVGVDRSMTEQEVDRWGSRIDDIIAGYPDHKGIIHTVSYKMAQAYMRRSKHGSICLSHQPGVGGVERAIQRFRGAKAPACLISPCISAGHDFPDDQCRFQIIAKVGFPNFGDPLIEARRAVGDDAFLIDQTAQWLVQACGRAVRSPEDWADTYIVDNHVLWFIREYRDHFPEWFLAALKINGVTPGETRRTCNGSTAVESVSLQGG